jgi:hypothetical protein
MASLGSATISATVPSDGTPMRNLSTRADDGHRRLGILHLGVGDGQLFTNRPQPRGLVGFLRMIEPCACGADGRVCLIQVLARGEPIGGERGFARKLLLGIERIRTPFRSRVRGS